MSEIHRLKAWRERQTPPLSQEEAGKRVGVTRFTWMRWEAGSPIDVDLLPKVSSETGVPAKELRSDLAGLFMSVGACQ